MLAPGDPAPAFSLVDQNGSKVTLTSLQGHKALVYFYPKADTAGCTTQACGLRDVLPQLDSTVVVGISPDSPVRLKAFDQKYGLGFVLLSDPDHAVADAYGVWGDKSMYGRTYQGIIRSAFLVDEQGDVMEAWYKISPKDTPKRLLKAVAA